MVSKIKTEFDYRVPNQLAQRYLARNDGVTLASSTVTSYDSHLTQYTQFLQDHGLSVLDAEFEDVRLFIESLVRCGNRQSTIESKLSTIAELYRFIQLRTDAADELSLDPLEFRDLDFDQYNTAEPIEREALTREEIRKLFDAFESYRNRLMAIVGIETGARNSDIRTLRVEDVSIDERRIHIRDPKGGRSYDVPISDDLALEIEFWLKHHRNGYITSPDAGYLFPSQDGEKLESNGSLNTIIVRAAERAGIQKCNWPYPSVRRISQPGQYRKNRS